MLQYLKYINIFSIPKFLDIEELKNLKFRYVILHFFVISLLIYLPLMVNFAFVSPYELTLKLYPVETLELVYSFSQENNLDFQKLQDTGEISQYLETFNNLVIQSGLYQQVFNFVMIGSFFLVIIIISSYFLILSVTYKYTRSLYSTITLKNILKISVFSSTLTAVFCVLLSILIGILHLFVFQVVQCFWIILFLKTYDKKEKEIVAEL